MHLANKAALIVLLALSGSALGQEAGYLDSRVVAEKEPEVVQDIFGGSSSGGTGKHIEAYPFAVTVVKLEAVPLEAGPSVLWTIRLTNTGERSLLLPSSSNWSSVAREGVASRSALTLFVQMQPSCDGKAFYRGLTQNKFYGSSAASESMITVDPGEWVTVVGSGPACSGDAVAAYKAVVGISATTWTKTPTGLRREEQQLSRLEARPVDAKGVGLK